MIRGLRQGRIKMNYENKLGDPGSLSLLRI